MRTIDSKYIDIAALCGFVALGIVYANLTKDMFIGKSAIAALTTTVLPSIYLGIRAPKPWKKIILTTLIFGGLYGFFFEFIQQYAGGYNVISVMSNWKLFGVLSLDNILGHMEMTFFTIVFYCHFVSPKQSHCISPAIKIGLLIGLLASLATLAIFILIPQWLHIPYSYTTMGTVALIFPLCLAVLRPQSISNMTAMIPFFFPYYLLCEYFAVQLGYWSYPGNHYLGYVQLLNTSFPLEELLFWMLCYAPTLVAFYELFINNPEKEQLAAQ